VLGISSQGASNATVIRGNPHYIFELILAADMFYAATHLISDLSVEHATTIRPFMKALALSSAAEAKASMRKDQAQFGLLGSHYISQASRLDAER
jgi:hypothetical protein